MLLYFNLKLIILFLFKAEEKYVISVKPLGDGTKLIN